VRAQNALVLLTTCGCCFYAAPQQLCISHTVLCTQVPNKHFNVLLTMYELLFSCSTSTALHMTHLAVCAGAQETLERAADHV
jgi:hypothetical protein